MIRRVVALLLVLCATAAHADQLRPGYLEFTQHSATDWRLVWKAPLVGGITPASQPILPAGCAQFGMPKRQMTAFAMISTSIVQCNRSVRGGRIGISSLEAAQTDVLVRVAPLNTPVQALRLTATEPTTIIAKAPDRWQVAKTYFVIGIEHIVFGYDHLLFVVALVLLLQRVRAIVWAVTAFTIAHSITLVGTTLGFVGLPSRPVEAIIALSIVFLAVEIVKKTPGMPRLSERIPWAVAFAFGLLHGFGFAGALAEIGLPQTDVPTALLAFNLGVEAGQLAIVATTLSAIAAVQKLSAAAFPPVVRVTSYAIGILANSWLIERLVM
jgi:hydrogenase/urease accessory protein HupE